MPVDFEVKEIISMSPMIEVKHEKRGYTISRKRVTRIAHYANSVGSVSVVPVVEGKPFNTKHLVALSEAVHPSYFVEVRVGDEVLASGFDFAESTHDWEKIAAAEFKKYSARKVSELKAKQAQEKAEGERRAGLREFAETVKREAFNFANELLFQTPNSHVAQKVRDLYPSAFIDVTVDNDHHRWYRFADPNGEICDSVCPSCGGEDIARIRDSSTGLIYRICHSQNCNFRWADKPQRCPACHYGELEVEMAGAEVYVGCKDLQNCRYNAKLGRLPRVPSGEEEPTLRASVVPGGM